MFINLLFIILVVILTSYIPDNSFNIAWPISPGEAFWYGLGLYGFILFALCMQNYFFRNTLKKHTDRMLIWANIQLLAFLVCYYFVLGAFRVFQQIPLVGQTETIVVLTTFLFYFGGLVVFHRSASSTAQLSKSWQELYLLIPFLIPLTVLSIISDILKVYDEKHYFDDIQGLFILTLILLSFLIGNLIFLPFCMQKVWRCQLLPNSPLKTRLEALCKIANFKHGGLKIWTILDQSITAAILGTFSRFRYVIFTPRLLQETSIDEVEAILAHEIGHNYRKHLLLLPLILAGVPITLESFLTFFSPSINQFFHMEQQLYPSNWWPILYLLAMLIPGLVLIALYIRYVFGLFSRLFERQADLHVFSLHISPKHLISALNYIGTATGNIHNKPNWHHYSIQQRIDFLEQAERQPEIIDEHHLKVKRYLWLYLFILLCSCFILFG